MMTQEESNPKQAYGDSKVPLQLVPPAASIYIALGLREGALKYGDWNFRHIRVEAMTYVGAMKRHLDALVDGEWYDEEPVIVNGVQLDIPAKPHLAGLMASAAILADCFERGTLIDDFPPSGGAKLLLKDYAWEREDK